MACLRVFSFRWLGRNSWAGALAMLGLVGCAALPRPLRLDPVNPAAVIRQAGQLGLVPVNQYDRSIRWKLPYATPDNAFRRTVYPSGFPALAADATAAKLAAAQRMLSEKGLRLVVLDAYRPPEVQWQIYQLFQDDAFVADPRKKWSKHCYGRAVDVTLADKSGNILPMPSRFDDFSTRAAANYVGNDPAIRQRLKLLQEAMLAAGFSIYAEEWWHFNDLSDPKVLEGPPIYGHLLGLPVQKSVRTKS